MKKNLKVFVLLAGIFSVSFLYGQGLKIGIEGQGAFPSGNFKNTADAGWGGSALVVINLGGFGITGNLGYLTFGEKGIEELGGDARISTNTIPFLGGLRLYLGGGVGPKFHIGGQVGLSSV